MKVIEKFVEGKLDNQELCEDGIAISDNFIAVIDGVSSQGEFRYEGKKTGRLICEILQEAIPKIPFNYNISQAIEFINNYILEFYKKINIYDKIKDDRASQPAASCVLYSKYHNQIWLIGDCMALYGDNIIIENGLEVDNLYMKLRVLLAEYYLSTGYTEEQLIEHDVTKDIVRLLEKRQPYIRNKKLGNKYEYAVIDGFNKVNLELVRCIDVPNNVKEIVFVSERYKPVPSKELVCSFGL